MGRDNELMSITIKADSQIQAWATSVPKWTSMGYFWVASWSTTTMGASNHPFLGIEFEFE